MPKITATLNHDIMVYSHERITVYLVLAAPDVPPQDVTVSEVTNSSMLVWWKRPPTMNGHLRCYQVYYNSDVVTVEYPANLPAKDPPTVQVRSHIIPGVSTASSQSGVTKTM